LLNPLVKGTVEGVNGTTWGIPPAGAASRRIAGEGTISFGGLSNYPLAFAAAPGINSLLAVRLVPGEALPWPQAMGLVVIEGIIIVLLAVSGFRSAVFNAIPMSMKAAIGVGIGLFIAMIGFVDGGFVTRVPDAAMTTVPVGLGQGGSIASWPVFIFVIGLIICG